MDISTLLASPLSVAVYSLLMAAVVSLWITPRPFLWMSLVMSAFAVALYEGRITVVGLVLGLSFGLTCFTFYRIKLSPVLRALLGTFLVLFSFALGSHQLPGFKNWLVLSDFALSPDSIPMRLYLNFDKPLVGLFITGFGIARIRSLKEWSSALRTTAPVILFSVLTLLGLSMSLHYVRVDLKWVGFSWIWVLINLLFTCVTEEAFFRGFLQNQLGKLLQTWHWGRTASWLIVSALFGIIHLPGGWAYVCLSIIAGLFYGYAYLKTQRIESSILVHFSINAIHFLAFSYPALKG